MDYDGLVKRLVLPPGRTPPTLLAWGDVRAHAITRAHLHDDVQGINASLDLIRRTRGGGWPAGPSPRSTTSSTWSGTRPSSGTATRLTYALYDDRATYSGCCYFYPIGGRTP